MYYFSYILIHIYFYLFIICPECFYLFTILNMYLLGIFSCIISVIY